MRHSPMAVLGFLIGLTLVPAVIFYGIAFGTLRYTNSGLLFHRAEVVMSTTFKDANSGEEKKELHCSYFTGTRVLERRFSYEELPYDETGLLRKGNCPFWIDVS